VRHHPSQEHVDLCHQPGDVNGLRSEHLQERPVERQRGVARLVPPLRRRLAQSRYLDQRVAPLRARISTLPPFKNMKSPGFSAVPLLQIALLPL
jgi:hypothetical protein